MPVDLTFALAGANGLRAAAGCDDSLEGAARTLAVTLAVTSPLEESFEEAEPGATILPDARARGFLTGVGDAKTALVWTTS